MTDRTIRECPRIPEFHDASIMLALSRCAWVRFWKERSDAAMVSDLVSVESNGKSRETSRGIVLRTLAAAAALCLLLGQDCWAA